MTAYRFCRSDDLGLLAEAHGLCRGPEHEGEPPLDRARLKELIREVDLWSSSSMVAFEGRDPVGVLLGCKRDAATLILALRVHPGHRRKGHARHLLTSLSSKLAILGPPQLVAEVPADRPAALALFEACGWRREETLLDLRREARADDRGAAGKTDGPIAPLTLEEALASGLLAASTAGWQRDPDAFLRQADRLGVLGFYSAERLEAVVIHRALHARAAGRREVDLLALGATESEVGRLGLGLVLQDLENQADGAPLVFPRLSPAEIAASATPLLELFFKPADEYLRFATEAKSA